MTDDELLEKMIEPKRSWWDEFCDWLSWKVFGL